MSAYDLVLKAKEHLKIETDNKFAEIIGVSRMNISNWKMGRSNPDGITMLKLADLAGLNPHDALFLVTQKPQEHSTALIPYSESPYIMLNRRLREFSDLIHFADRRHYS